MIEPRVPHPLVATGRTPAPASSLHEAVIAMVAGASCTDIGRAIHVHPTLAEWVNSAAGGVHRPWS